ncbi:Ribosomal protein S18 acetylase RimI [Beijerinckia sp. 28-YEA-48]|nr:Ribosomal protein S18 acetylase RimI [Beijerinckia sp. 28-YEA-48]
MSDAPFSCTIREATVADAPTLANVHVACWRETYPGLIPEAIIDRLSVQDRTQRWHDMLGNPDAYNRTIALLAECGGKVVGFGSYSDQHAAELKRIGFTGEIGAIYLLRQAQKQGLGLILMAAMARGLIGHGHEAASLWVLRENGQARSFYEQLGGQVVGQKEDKRGEAVLIEVAYGWRDLPLLSRCDQSSTPDRAATS